MQEFIDENETPDEDLFEHHRFEIAKGQQPLRIDKFLINSIENTTRSKIQKAADAGTIFVNDIAALYSVASITIRISPKWSI